jgi:hypothetical protein
MKLTWPRPPSRPSRTCPICSFHLSCTKILSTIHHKHSSTPPHLVPLLLTLFCDRSQYESPAGGRRHVWYVQKCCRRPTKHGEHVVGRFIGWASHDSFKANCSSWRRWGRRMLGNRVCEHLQRCVVSGPNRGPFWWVESCAPYLPSVLSNPLLSTISWLCHKPVQGWWNQFWVSESRFSNQGGQEHQNWQGNRVRRMVYARRRWYCKGALS